VRSPGLYVLAPCPLSAPDHDHYELYHVAYVIWSGR
jgi:hypothetical protein